MAEDRNSTLIARSSRKATEAACYFWMLITMIGCSLTAGSNTSTLYSRLGAQEGISKIVDTFTVNCVSDPRVNAYFLAAAADRARLSRFKTHISDLLCELSGGPCQYRGKDMQTAHTDMRITDEQFNAFIENLVRALDTATIVKGDQESLVGMLGPMRREIVESRS